jgi:hypothetical protein
MSPLQFNLENHVYTVDGVKIPSVTTVLSSTGISDYSRVPSQTLEEAAARGTAVHRILELYDMGQLAECPEWATEYLDAWKKFKTEMDVKILACEMRVFHDKFWFAGTLDRIAMIGGEKYILDIKTTSAVMGAHSIQTAAYSLAYRKQSKERAINRCSVYVWVGGKYQFIQHKGKGDESVFLAALQVHNWKVKHDVGVSL